MSLLATKVPRATRCAVAWGNARRGPFWLLFLRTSNLFSFFGSLLFVPKVFATQQLGRWRDVFHDARVHTTHRIITRRHAALSFI
jgi:hypothetical protein